MIMLRRGLLSLYLAAGIFLAAGAQAVPPNFAWMIVPTQQLTPGTLADPDPLSIQDGRLNSSLVLRLTRDGQPVTGEEVAWSSSDSTSNIQFLNTRSDASGLVRAWYFAGTQLAPQVTVTHALSGATTNVTLQRVATPSPTVGRYVSTYFTAPEGTYSATTISVIPNTAPERTYYALTSLWRTDGQFALYGGLQMTDCAALGPDPHPGIAAACAGARVSYRGRLALFSSWNWTSPTGATLKPALVGMPSTSSCRPFNHEGDGLQCVAPLDWGTGEEWRWTLEELPGASPGYQRVRVTASNSARGISQEIATVDIGGTPRMRDFGAFNENWDGQRAASCLEVALRSMTIVSIGFWNGQQWVKANQGQAQGGLYDSSMTRCENYGLGVGAGGLTVASGGTGLWVRLADALVAEPGTGRMIFPNQDQVDSQWQALDLSTIVSPPATLRDVNQHGLTGSWYEAATSGQGFEVEVFPDLSSGNRFDLCELVHLRYRWRWRGAPALVYAQGQVVTGQPNASLTIYQNTGGNFDAPPVTNAQAVGTATLRFDTCTSGQLTYSFTGGTGRTGTIPLTRLTQNMTCSATTPHPTNADFALSGNWYDPATSGQGMTVEVNPGSGAFFVAWYTYVPNGAGAGAAGQRWYTAQAAFTPGLRSIPVTIYETTGGVFDTPTPPGQKTVSVGTGTMAFQSCSAATFNYNFTGGSSGGASGTIALKRVGPVPAGCAS